MKFDLNNVQMSCFDIKYSIILPEKPSKELAELIGILAGDGYIGSLEKGKDHTIEIAGHAKDDLPYLKYVKELIYKLFKIKMKLRVRKEINGAYIYKGSQGFLSFLYSIGYKKKYSIIKIPNWIWDEEDLTRYFIKGLFDTDGSLALKRNHGKNKFYPVVSIVLKDEKLIKKVGVWIKQRNISVYVGKDEYFDKRTNKIYTRYRLQVSGYKNSRKWLKLIGTSNLKHKEKYGNGEI